MSFILPLSLIAGLVLTGAGVRTLTIAETIQPTAMWEYERTYCSPIGIDEWCNASYSSSDFQVNESLTIEQADDYMWSPKYAFSFRLFLNAEARVGYINNVTLYFVDSETPMLLGQTSHDERLGNVSLVKSERLTSSEAVIEWKGTSESSAVYLVHHGKWGLNTPLNMTATKRMTCEVTYFNGTGYEKLVQPFQLTFVPDDNGSFEKAEEISLGKTYLRSVTAPLRSLQGDEEDYYRVWLEEGQKAELILADYSITGMEMWVYDSERNLLKDTGHLWGNNTVRYGKDVVTLVLDIDQGGWWFVRVAAPHGGFHTYTLEITQGAA